MTKTEKQAVKAMIEESLKDAKTSVVKDCTFNGVHFDAKAVEAIETIASGLLENAKALGALASVLKASNVQVEAMLRIGG